MHKVLASEALLALCIIFPNMLDMKHFQMGYLFKFYSQADAKEPEILKTYTLTAQRNIERNALKRQSHEIFHPLVFFFIKQLLLIILEEPQSVVDFFEFWRR